MRTALHICAILLSAAALAQGETFVVAPGGNDGHPGTAERPLATLEAARDAAREADGGPHRIVVMPGDYYLTKTLELDARDNGLTIEAGEGGKASDGTPATFVIRGYPGGAVQSVCDGGAPPADAARLASAIRFATGKWTQPRGLDVNRGAWRGEWAIPFEALGLKPAAGLKVPFNLSTYRADDGLWRCWEGTLAETWTLDQAGTLELK